MKLLIELIALAIVIVAALSVRDARRLLKHEEAFQVMRQRHDAVDDAIRESNEQVARGVIDEAKGDR